jgi:hypothetical protein
MPLSQRCRTRSGRCRVRNARMLAIRKPVRRRHAAHRLTAPRNRRRRPTIRPHAPRGRIRPSQQPKPRTATRRKLPTPTPPPKPPMPAMRRDRHDGQRLQSPSDGKATAGAKICEPATAADNPKPAGDGKPAGELSLAAGAHEACASRRRPLPLFKAASIARSSAASSNGLRRMSKRPSAACAASEKPLVSSTGISGNRS